MSRSRVEASLPRRKWESTLPCAHGSRAGSLTPGTQRTVLANGCQLDGRRVRTDFFILILTPAAITPVPVSGMGTRMGSSPSRSQAREWSRRWARMGTTEKTRRHPTDTHWHSCFFFELLRRGFQGHEFFWKRNSCLLASLHRVKFPTRREATRRSFNTKRRDGLDAKTYATATRRNLYLKFLKFSKNLTRPRRCATTFGPKPTRRDAKRPRCRVVLYTDFSGNGRGRWTRVLNAAGRGIRVIGGLIIITSCPQSAFSKSNIISMTNIL